MHGLILLLNAVFLFLQLKQPWEDPSDVNNLVITWVTWLSTDAYCQAQHTVGTYKVVSDGDNSKGDHEICGSSFLMVQVNYIILMEIFLCFADEKLFCKCQSVSLNHFIITLFVLQK